MTIQQAVEKYQEAFKEIAEYFGHSLSAIDDYTDVYWRADSNSRTLEFDYEPLTDDEPMYAEDLLEFQSKEDYSLARINNGCGDQFYVLLDNTKRKI